MVTGVTREMADLGPKLQRGPSLAIRRKPRSPQAHPVQSRCAVATAPWATSLSLTPWEADAELQPTPIRDLGTAGKLQRLPQIRRVAFVASLLSRWKG